MCGLNFYAQGSYQKAVGIDSRLSIAQSTVSVILYEITCAINEHHMRQWIHFPTRPQEVQQIVQRYILISKSLLTLFKNLIKALIAKQTIRIKN